MKVVQSPFITIEIGWLTEFVNQVFSKKSPEADGISNKPLKSKTGARILEPLHIINAVLKLRCFPVGRMVRMNEERSVRNIVWKNLFGKRKRGGPKKREESG